MMATRRSFASSALLFQMFWSICQGSLVETCDELQAAFNLTKTQDVVIQMYPFEDIYCTNFTTMSMDSHSLTVESSEDVSSAYRSLDLYEIRFEVTGGATLSWGPNVRFIGSDTRDANGGGVYVGEESSVHFASRLEMTDVKVASVKYHSDFATYILRGGCVYTDGEFSVGGQATLTDCDNRGAGESNPGPGGGMYVGPQGSVSFNKTLYISEAAVDDSGGNGGAGIYNEGIVQIYGDAKFETLRAQEGGAIYNAAGARFSFEDQAAAEFVDTLTPEGTAGALYNEGYLAFSGPALFYDSGNPSIYVSADGVTGLSEQSVFWGNDGNNEPFIEVESGGMIKIPKSVSFVGNDDSDCSTVYYEEDDSCL